jgi:hypothetical protein
MIVHDFLFQKKKREPLRKPGMKPEFLAPAILSGEVEFSHPTLREQRQRAHANA